MLIGLALVAALGTAGPAAAQDSRIVRVSFPSEDGSLTPYTFMTGYPLVMLVYDSLAWRDEGGVARPWLASSIRRGGDGRTVTVRLRSGIRWHDGRPFSADDVVFTYRHMADREHPRFTPQLRDIDSVTAPDARTVVFTLRRASLGFADQPLADVPILPRHLWEGLAEGQSAPSGLPIGTGPYRLVRHAAGGSYSFQANRRYFKGRPAVDVLQVPIVTKEEDAFSMLRRGSLDAAPVNFPAGASAGRPRGIRFAEGNSYNGTMLEFNLTRAPFAALEARRTIARALRLNAIAGNKNGPGAMATAEYGMLHPDSPWASRTQLHRSDVAAARLSLAEQRIQPFTIIASTSDGVRLEAARRIAGMLREAGAQVEVEELPARQFDRRVGRGEVTPDFDAAVVGIPTLASYDPAYLRNVFGDPQRALRAPRRRRRVGDDEARAPRGRRRRARAARAGPPGGSAVLRRYDLRLPLDRLRRLGRRRGQRHPRQAVVPRGDRP